MRKPVVVLGIPIDDLNISETLDRIEQMVQVGRVSGRAHQVATVNADFVVRAQFDPELRYLLRSADLLTADGMPLVWGGRFLGASVPGRVTGADLVPALAQRAAERGLSIFFLGGEPGVAARAADLLKKKYPRLQVAGIHSPPYSPILEMDTSFLEEIRSARPDILLVAFGNPKQEKWIGMHGHRLGVPVMIGVGGSLDFISGHFHRAPQWMQRSGLEWLFRLLQEPRRLFRRYAVDLVVFGSLFLRQCWAMRLPRSHRRHPSASLKLVQERAILNLHGCITRESLDVFDPSEQQGLKTSPHILVNLAQVEFLDSSAIGQLLELGNQARRAGGQLSLAAIPHRILRILRLLKLDNLFPIYSNVEAYLATDETSKSAAAAAGQIPSPTDGHVWAVLKGPRVLDASTSQDLLDAGISMLQANPFVICDLSETIVLASAGLAALASLRQMSVNLHGKFRVVICSEDAMRVIKRERFDQILPLYRNFSQAIASNLFL
jgi:N-acetylglucosaminyldiphosphoundecaprenol N-acetyl-beta-D-mannosaminyltransferase